MGPEGFLAELWYLTPVSREDFTQRAGPADFCDAEPGEVLAPPAWLPFLTDGEVADGASFMGLASIAGTSLGTIRCGDGHAVVAALQGALQTFGRDGEEVLGLIPAVLELSARLETLHRRGVRVLRPGLDLHTLIPV